jgi:hypothetical protein
MGIIFRFLRRSSRADLFTGGSEAGSGLRHVTAATSEIKSIVFGIREFLLFLSLLLASRRMAQVRRHRIHRGANLVRLGSPACLGAAFSPVVLAPAQGRMPAQGGKLAR